MACFRPLAAWQSDPGAPLRFSPMGASVEPDLEVACGQCIGCRLERSRNWAVRIMCEAQMHSANSFVTLTYDDDHLPYDGSLNYVHVQLFMHRMRKRVGAFRFFNAGEYGDITRRPHYHMCLFGHDFSNDRKLWSGDGAFALYESDLLNSLWGNGQCLIGDLSFESAAYVSRYVVKKITGDAALDHYTVIDPCSGEVFHLEPEFCHMSLKPGIGKPWFDKYKIDIKNLGGVVSRGKLVNPPKYFHTLLERDDVVSGDIFSDDQQYTRYLDSCADRINQTRSRLYVREQMAYARLALSKRPLE